MAEMFLLLDGIDGESLDEKYHDKIEITEWTWTLANTAPYNMKTSKADSSKVNVQNIVITKIYDKASVNLARYCALGTYIPKGKIICRKNSGEKKVEYVTIGLTDVKIAQIDWKGMGAEQTLKEDVHLNFGQFKIEYKLQSDLGDEVKSDIPGDVEFGYSMLTHEETS
jgi:type VI secretion system secreted protein Hcp